VTEVPLRGGVSGSNYTLNVGLSMIETFGGLLVVEVASSSAGETAGIQANDVITAIEGSATLTPQEFYKQIDAALDIEPEIDGVSVTTIRNNVTVARYLTIRSSTSDTSSGGETVTKKIPYEL
jgi:S1-C subfamily serine protease